MKVQLLLVPYDSGKRGWRMGAGPSHLVQAGLCAHLEACGHNVTAETLLDDPSQPPAEIRTAFELMRRLSSHVRLARDAGRFPLVVAGNCSTACGTMSGLPAGGRSVFWFDAHGDLNTPATTASGFLDGMALAMLQGLCWETLTGSVPGYAPVPPERVALLGVRDLDPPEKALVDRTPLIHLPPAALADDLPGILARPAFQTGAAYIHCDLDVLDPGVGQANAFPVPGGLRVDALLGAIRRIGEHARVQAASLTAYDPSCDPGGGVCSAAFRTAEALLDAAARSSTSYSFPS